MVEVDGFQGFHDLVAGIQGEIENFDSKLEVFLESQVDELQMDHAEFFSASKSPSGNKWADLAESTIRRKGHSTILVETDKLRQSLTEAGANFALREFFRESDAVALEFGTAVPYAHWHMTGTETMPARPEVGFSRTRVEKIQEELADLLQKTVLTKLED